jgi:hypothetical protein
LELRSRAYEQFGEAPGPDLSSPTV